MKQASTLVTTAVLLSIVCGGLSAPARAQKRPRREVREMTAEPPRLKNFDPSLRRKADAPPGGERAGKAGEGKGGEEEDVIRVETTLVLADVLVLDKQGRAVKGLGRDDFVIREDDAPQQIGTFSLGHAATVPRSIVLVIDHSGSQLPYLKTSVEAAKTLVDKLGPRDRMAIVTDSVELLTDFTRDRALLKEKLDTLLPRTLSGDAGRSEHYSALLATLNELFDEEDLRPVVIFQADGEELMTLKGERRVNGIPQRSFDFEDLLTAAERSRATVYAIIPGVRFVGLSEGEQLRQARLGWENWVKARDEAFKDARRLPMPRYQSDEFLKYWAAGMHRFQLAMAGLAKHTGGWADYLERPEDAEAVYARVFAGMSSRYVIGYYPTNGARDGKRRKVTIEVRGHPEYIVWGRKTYIAPGP